LNNKIGIILGSGLNKITEELKNPSVLNEDIDSFHKLKILSGKILGKEVILFSGRRHFYEGYKDDKILESVELAKEFGIKTLIITNAAGGINKTFRISDLMLISSHFNFLKKSFVKCNIDKIYDINLIKKIKKIALMNRLNLRTGSYCCATGPMYETKSEIRFLSKIGVDAVGMSTIPEVLKSKDLGINIVAVSCITNLLSENPSGITNHEEVIEAGKNAYENFSALIKIIISNSNELF
jgi:purine-nucleoside phosphorylase